MVAFRRTLALVVGVGIATAAVAKPRKIPAHEHGHGKVSIAVDGLQLAVTMAIPGDGIFGFEHPPKTDAQRQVVAGALRRLRDEPVALLGIPADLACKPTKVEVKSSLEDTASTRSRDAKTSEHADVDAEYRFACKLTPAGATLKLMLFAAFPRIAELDVQVVTPDAQHARVVTGKATEIKL